MENVYRRFWFLANHPNAGRRRDEDLRPGMRTFPADNYVVVHRVETDQAGNDLVVILHVVHASRDLISILQEN
jgi:plasmid stabilization system protein ParE